MITNIIATIMVTLATNTVEVPSDFLRWVQDPCVTATQFGLVYQGAYNYIGVDPQSKYVTNTVVEITTISFDLNGRSYVASSSRVLSQDVSKYQLTIDWTQVAMPVEDKNSAPVTNQAPIGSPITGPTGNVYTTTSPPPWMLPKLTNGPAWPTGYFNPHLTNSVVPVNLK